MKELILYTTSGCHLCEQAEELIAPHIQPEGIQLKLIDIADSDQLFDRYGIRIPVIQRGDTLDELGWPFDESQLVLFLSN